MGVMMHGSRQKGGKRLELKSGLFVLYIAGKKFTLEIHPVRDRAHDNENDCLSDARAPGPP